MVNGDIRAAKTEWYRYGRNLCHARPCLPKYQSYYGILKLARTDRSTRKVSHRNDLFQMSTAMGGWRSGEWLGQFVQCDQTTDSADWVTIKHDMKVVSQKSVRSQTTFYFLLRLQNTLYANCSNCSHLVWIMNFYCIETSPALIRARELL